MAAQAGRIDRAAGGGAGGWAWELVATALPIKSACGVAARPDCVLPWTASRRGRGAPTARWRRHGTSTHGPGPDRGLPDGGSGPVSRPGPVPSSMTTRWH